MTTLRPAQRDSNALAAAVWPRTSPVSPSSELPHHATDSAYAIDGRSYARQDPHFEPALALAYANRTRPRCLCVPGGVEMYISRVADHYVIKRMPMSATLHAAPCAARHGVIVIKAEHDYRDPAIQQDEAGITRIAVDVRLNTLSGAPLSSAAVPDSAACSQDAPRQLVPRQHRLTLTELVHHVWHEAGLDWWHPRFEGRRNWAVVRAHLRRAMADIYVGRRPMVERTFIPEPFRPERRLAIERRRQHDWAELVERQRPPDNASPNGGGRTRLLIIAEVKEIAPPDAASAWRTLTLRHLPGLTFEMTERGFQSMVHAYSDLLAHWTQGAVVHLLIVAVFDPGQAGPCKIESPALIGATKEWMLVRGVDELDRIKGLVRQGRAFRQPAFTARDQCSTWDRYANQASHG